MKKKLLLTAQDYSSGINIIPLYDSNRLRELFDVEVIVSGLSCTLFPEKNNEIYHFSEKTVNDSAEKKIEKTKRFLIKHLDKIKPDILLTGISGLDFGIDEMTNFLCKGHIKTFSYQDYWGHINQYFGVSADHILVLDEIAEKLTSNLTPSVKITTVGSMKYDYYKNLAKNHISGEMVKVKSQMNMEYWVFIGQPLWNLPSYRKTISLVMSKAKKNNKLLFYLPHPGESLSFFDNNLKEIIFFPEHLDIRRETFVLNAQKMLTCFSTLSFDILILKEIMNLRSPSMAVLFLFDEIQEYHKRHSGNLLNFPLVGKGVREISSLVDFEDFLKANLFEEEVQTLAPYKNATHKVISCLVE